MSNNVLVGGISIFALVFFCLFYRKNSGISFFTYIYFAMFPHKLHAFSFFAYDDLILKLLLFIGFIILLKSSKKIIIKWDFFFLVIAIGFVDIIAMFTSQYFNNSLALTGFMNILFMFFFLMLLSNEIKSLNAIETLFKIIIINSIFLSLGAIVESKLNFSVRSELGLGNPNYLAFYIAVAFIIILYFEKEKLFFRIICSVLYVFGIVFTGSTSVLFCVTLSIFFKFLSLLINKGSVIRSITFILSIFITALIVIIIVLSFSSNLLDNSFVSSVLIGKDLERLDIWRDAVSTWKSSMKTVFFGVGYNCWRSSGVMGYVTHNDFLRLMAETGGLGLICFSFIWFGSIKMILQAKTKNMVFYISLLLLTVFFSSFHNNINSLLFWLVLFIPFFDKKIELREDKRI